jgi:hypothetical protein
MVVIVIVLVQGNNVLTAASDMNEGMAVQT